MPDFVTKARQFTEEFRARGVSDNSIRNFLKQKFVEESKSATQVAGKISGALQEGILPIAAKVTQAFGNFNPKLEIFSKGINTGTDFAVPTGTPVSLPKGEWEIIESFSGAKEGMRNTNRGYGNSIVARNTETGETMRLSHLSQVKAGKGQKIRGGVPIALSGSTGNSTGPHLDIEFRNEQGKLMDILKSRFGGGLS